MDNPIRTALEGDEVVFGARVTTHDPMIIEVYGELGFDFVWIDFEHGGASPHETGALDGLARACDVADVAPLVRVPSADEAIVRKVLDAGLHTILVPRVESAAEAREAVGLARFTYDGAPGHRGHAGTRANTYGASFEVYAERADATTLVGVQIETADGMSNLEGILAVPDLGFIVIGSGDLAVSLGHPMKREHTVVEDAVEEIRSACLDAGVPVGTPVSTTAAAEDAVAAGYQLIRIGDELNSIRETLGDRLKSVR